MVDDVKGAARLVEAKDEELAELQSHLQVGVVSYNKICHKVEHFN